jgi:uncharacterized protein (UPF0332 family)
MKFKINPENKKLQFKIHILRAKENLKGAKILLKGKDYRGAISRAYYPFFEAAHAALITKGITAKTHAGLITLFDLHFVKTKKISKEFAKFYKEAKKAREEADYGFLKKFTKKEAEKLLKLPMNL